MILLGIVYGAVTGNMQAVTDAAFASAKDAVTLCITMTGMMALWVGVMEIARGAGLIRKWSEKLKPFIHFLFPGIPKGHKAQEYIAANMIANILGLGSAATPAGLKAMEELAEIKKEKGLPEEVASNEMCTFLILNISSLQLIPVSVQSVRKQQSLCHHRSGYRSHAGKHGNSGYFLQNKRKNDKRYFLTVLSCNNNLEKTG